MQNSESKSVEKGQWEISTKGIMPCSAKLRFPVWNAAAVLIGRFTCVGTEAQHESLRRALPSCGGRNHALKPSLDKYRVAWNRDDVLQKRVSLC